MLVATRQVAEWQPRYLLLTEAVGDSTAGPESVTTQFFIEKYRINVSTTSQARVAQRCSTLTA
jgi:hypothetical protein